MRVESWHSCLIIFPFLTLLHLWAAPYTKVEESFNIQAIHDVLHYGIPFENAVLKFQALFDHMTFRGAVPRTFVGAIVVSGVAKPFIWLTGATGLSQQSIVRGALGLVNAIALAGFARSIRQTYGNATAMWYVALQGSQFHVFFYASRTLPNTYAFCLSTLALAALVPSPSSRMNQTKRTRLGFYVLMIATVVFRSELALLLGSHGLYLLAKAPSMNARLRLVRSAFLPACLFGLVIGLSMTVAVDTYFWQSPNYLWPEYEAFMSNVFPKAGNLGASAWGVSPWHWYLTSALPRIFMGTALLLPFSADNEGAYGARTRTIDHLVPSMVYIALYSFLPHKETRFIFPVVPSLTLCVALTAQQFSINADRHTRATMMLGLTIITTIVTAVLSHCILLPISALNYPGGHALDMLHAIHDSLQISYIDQPQVHVHVTNLALQSGVTKFIEQPSARSSPLGQSVNQLVTPKMSEKRSDSNIYGHEAERSPIIFPGDGARRSAITIHPSRFDRPTATSLPNSTKARRPRWTYDKSSNETLFLTPGFWDAFDYVVVETPARVIGAWEVAGEIKGLGRPRLVTSRTSATAQDSGKGANPTRQTLTALYGEHLGSALADINDVVSRIALTAVPGGRWVEWPMNTRLYILKRSESGITPNESAGRATEQKHDEKPLGLPATGEDRDQDILIDDMGPLVVNKDGTLSRLNNWAEMTDRERAKTVKYLRDRNQLRLANVEESLE